jgi:hypothetical protein
VSYRVDSVSVTIQGQQGNAAPSSIVFSWVPGADDPLLKLLLDKYEALTMAAVRSDPGDFFLGA